jgi:hypothetical protein
LLRFIKETLFFYPQEKTVFGEIGSDWEFYDQLVDLIVAKGSVGGAKAYFCAIFDEKEGGLKINIDEIQVPQAW